MRRFLQLLSGHVCAPLRDVAICGLAMLLPHIASAATVTVRAGGDLQGALNAAQPGDTILLEAGATFTGNFVLPAKSGTAFITIRSSAPDSSLPAARTRIDPSYSAVLPKLQSPNTAPALATAPSAHHYQLVALEFLANYAGYGDILALGDGSSAQNALQMVPHDLIVDRVYIHGDPANGQKRGIALNSASTTIQNSYIAEIKASGQDSQAICGWNGPGPYFIENNYLEAAGENVLFGGADPTIANLVPADLTFRHNYVTKQTAWRSQAQWTVKNLFELKNFQRAIVDGNVFEYNWLAAQPGYSILFTPRNQDGTAPWSVVQQVTFTNNIVRHVSSVFNILGRDDEHPSQLTNHITIRNNALEDVSGAVYGGNGRLLLIQGGDSIALDHNTAILDGSSAIYADSTPATTFAFTNNIVPDNSWAVMGSGTGPGNNTIAAYFPAGVFAGGVFAGSDAATYPTGNYYPPSLTGVGFRDSAAGDYSLGTSSPYRNAATDGLDVGCDFNALAAALALTPDVPAAATPFNGGTVATSTVTLEWVAAGATAYTVLFGTTNPPARAAAVDAPAYTTPPLVAGTTYYWQVLATNAAGTTPGPVWSFSAVAPLLTTPATLVTAAAFEADGGGDAWLYDSSTGRWREQINANGTFVPAASGSWSANWTILTGDFNADGRTDLLFYNPNNGYVVRGINEGTGQFSFFARWWLPGLDLKVADLNGDGFADVFAYNASTGEWQIALASDTGDFRYTRGQWSAGWQVSVGRWNNDAAVGLFLYNRSLGSWCRATAQTDGSFGYVCGQWSAWWDVYSGDFNGDGRTDILLYSASTGRWVLAITTDAGFTYESGQWASAWQVTIGDFDGDGRADVFVYNPGTGAWCEVLRGAAGGFNYYGGQWSAGWTIGVSDFNHDNRTDLLIYNPESGSAGQVTSTSRPGVFTYSFVNWGPGWTVLSARP